MYSTIKGDWIIHETVGSEAGRLAYHLICNRTIVIETIILKMSRLVMSDPIVPRDPDSISVQNQYLC